MPLTIRESADQRPAPGHGAALIADRRLYTDATKTVVLEHGDPQAAYVLCGQGSTIPAATVRHLRLAMVNGRVVQVKETPAPPVERKEAAPSEDKQAAPPRENKAKGRR